MSATTFTNELFIHALWRSSHDHTAVQTAAEATLPARLCAEAQQHITRWEQYATTPLHSLVDFARQAGLGSVHCKDEGQRFGLGSFKALGGAYAVAKVAEASHEALTVSCATEGNHGRSVAWGAQRAGVPCMIFLHENVSQAREDAIARYGAHIIRVPGSYDDAVRTCARVSEEKGWRIISDTTWDGYHEIPRLVWSGYSVIANEIKQELEQAPTHVFLQAGVGGMAAAMMASLGRCWPGEPIRFIVVEPRAAACLLESARAGGRFRSTPGPFNTITAGLACGEPADAVLPLIYEASTMMLAIDDDAIKRAMKHYARPTGADPEITAGASGAAGMAGLQTVLHTPALREQLELGPQSRVLLLNTENATDPETYTHIVGTWPK